MSIDMKKKTDSENGFTAYTGKQLHELMIDAKTVINSSECTPEVVQILEKYNMLYGHSKKVLFGRNKEKVTVSKIDSSSVMFKPEVCHKSLLNAYKAINKFQGKDILVEYVHPLLTSNLSAMHAVTKANYIFKWDGGLLTNFRTIRRKVFNMIKKASFKTGSPQLRKKIKRSESIYKGIHNLESIPKLLITFSTKNISIKEAIKTKVPIVGVVDTDSSDIWIDYPIYANNDCVFAGCFILAILRMAIKQSAENKKVIQNKNQQ